MENKKKTKISRWSKEADYRIKNHKWLRYSGHIAMRVIAAMEEHPDMNQSKLAKAIGVSPQYISKLLKGHQNLSLETISKISEALGVELIAFPEFKYSRPTYLMNADCKIKSNQDQNIGLTASKADVSELLSVVGNDEVAHFRVPFKKSKPGYPVQAAI
jgi:transcriptional regulator with XRE-family HTH domain